MRSAIRRWRGSRGTKPARRPRWRASGDTQRGSSNALGKNLTAFVLAAAMMLGPLVAASYGARGMRDPQTSKAERRNAAGPDETAGSRQVAGYIRASLRSGSAAFAMSPPIRAR